MNTLWIFLTLCAILIAIIVIIKKKPTETFKVLAQEIGETIATEMLMKDGHNTVIRKLLGNNGKTIILLHNSPFDVQVWYPLYMYMQSLLKDGKQIPTLISYDLKGHGTAWISVPTQYNDSNPTNIAWTIQEFSDNLYEIYKQQMGTGKVIIAGFGFGANVAQEFALNHSDIIEHLFILSQSIQGPLPNALDSENQYLVNWINKNPNVSYLTLEQSFVQLGMCKWFQNKNPLICPYQDNQNDTIDTYQTVEYLLANKMYRESSATTFLQINKILNQNNFLSMWEQTTVSFPITMLMANLDVYISAEQIRNDNKTLKMASQNVQTYIVGGKHGFVLLEPEYISNLLNGIDMSKNPLTIESIQ
jgi:pimeloyl-ACP methyl ester carboxylesterase